MNRAAQRLATAWMVLTVTSCASPHGAAFPRAMKGADEAAEQHDLVEAVRRFDRAAEVALLARDRDEARHAAARMLARTGEVRGALQRLDALAHESPSGVEAASALYDAGALRLEHGEDDAGWRDLSAVLHDFPNDGAARPALHRYLAHLDETQGAAASLAWLRSVEPAMAKTERAEEVAYEIALRQERTGDASGARDAFLAMAAKWPYPMGALWDDALFHASLIDEKTGHPLDAAHDLEQMLSQREHSVIVGSYEKPRYAQAELKLGQLYRDEVHDHARARAAFRSLYADFPDSTVRDRGLFEEASLMKADGDETGACEELALLVRKFPASPYAACAHERCASLPRASDETPACHAYLLERGAR